MFHQVTSTPSTASSSFRSSRSTFGSTMEKLSCTLMHISKLQPSQAMTRSVSEIISETPSNKTSSSFVQNTFGSPQLPRLTANIQGKNTKDLGTSINNNSGKFTDYVASKLTQSTPILNENNLKMRVPISQKTGPFTSINKSQTTVSGIAQIGSVNCKFGLKHPSTASPGFR